MGNLVDQVGDFAGKIGGYANQAGNYLGNNILPQGSNQPMSDKKRLLLALLSGMAEGGDIVTHDGYAMYSPTGLSKGVSSAQKVLGDIDAEKRAEKKRKQELAERMEEWDRRFEKEAAARAERDRLQQGIRMSERFADQALRMTEAEKAREAAEKRRIMDANIRASQDAAKHLLGLTKLEEERAYKKKLEDEARRREVITGLGEQGAQHGFDYTGGEETSELERILAETKGAQKLEQEAWKRKQDEAYTGSRVKANEALAKSREAGISSDAVSSTELQMRKLVSGSLSDTAASFPPGSMDQRIHDRAARIVAEEGGSSQAAIDKARREIEGAGAGGDIPAGTNIPASRITEGL